MKKAFDSHFPLLGAVLHPSIRLAYFQDSHRWTSDIPVRAETLLEHLFEEYSSDDSTDSESATPSSLRNLNAVTVEEPKSIFDQAIMLGSGATEFRDPSEPPIGILKQSELASYSGGAYPCKNQNDPLGWWKAYTQSTVSSARSHCAGHPCHSRRKRFS
ncbi:hypothetical protein V8E55_003017 [Tylopilus felleus]